MGSRRRVAFLVNANSGFGTQILEGLARYHPPSPGWSVFVSTGEDEVGLMRRLRMWRGDGVIAALPSDRTIEAAAACRFPVVNVTGVVAQCPLPWVRGDDEEIGRMAARHFLERGFRHFAYSGCAGKAYADLRGKGFAEALAQVGLGPPVVDRWRPQMGPSRDKWGRGGMSWAGQLSGPLALLACDDRRAHELMQGCHEAGLHVPERVAILGVDNELAICGLSDPPLSSIDSAARQRGTVAAELLWRLMDGQPPPAQPLLVPPIGVVARQSTESLGMADAAVAAALRFIREHACDPIDVEKVLDHVGIARRTLERRFRRLRRCSPGREIIRQRMERAKRLLCDSDLSLLEITIRCGFAGPAHFSNAFRAQVGCSPSDFRKQYRHPRVAAPAPPAPA